MLSLLFFRGHGIVPVLVRLFTWKWFYAQKWKDVPSHVAIVVDSEYGVKRKYEAVVTGIQSAAFSYSEIENDKSLIAEIKLPFSDVAASRKYLDSQVGDRYGFEVVAITGLAVLSPPWVDAVLAFVWTRLMGGRNGETCPLHCSLLAKMSMSAGGFVFEKGTDNMPMSPNDLFLLLSGSSTKG